MVRFNPMLVGVAGAALLCGCTEAGFAQNAHVVTAGTLTDDIAGQDDYRWIDRARALWDAVGDSPPDYGFAYDGGTPVAWEMRDGYWVVVEDRAEGKRSYFFAPGERGPFLVRETDRSFGYQDGHVAAVYDGAGALVPRYLGARWLDDGEGLYRRGRRLRDALLDRQWEPVEPNSWVSLNLFFGGIDQRWDSGWRYRRDGFAFAEQQRWAAERARRAAMAAAFARWRSGGFQGPPPPGLGNHWDHRPSRPGRPPIAGQPGRPPVAGRPDQPDAGRPSRPWMWGGIPGGTRPGRPPNGEVRPGETPGAVMPPPGANVPGTRPADPLRPRPPRTDGAPDRPPRGDGDGIRPPRPDEDGVDRPGWQAPRPDGEGGRPGWGRPGWSGGERPQRPVPPARPPEAAPIQPTAPAAPPPPRDAGERRGGWMAPNWTRQPRPDAGSGEAPRPDFRPAAPQPQSAPPSRPSFSPPPEQHVAPPPPRPSFSPPPEQRIAPPPPPPRPPELRNASPLLRAKLEAQRGDEE